LLAALSTMVVAALPGVGPATAAPSVTIVTAVPSVPLNIATRAGVDGVALSWWRGSVTADATAPTSYVVRRRAEGYDLDWVVPTDLMSNFGGTSDTTLPVGLPATYTVAARNAAGDSVESVSTSATVPIWDGPYNPARKVLTMVWDEAQATVGAFSDRATTQATQDSAVPPTQGWDNGLVGYSSGPGSAFALPRDTPNGDYTVGPGEGLLNVSAMSGAPCRALNGASPSGSASVRRTAPSLSGGYASITVDADLLCDDGHRLRVELRWSTPDDFHALDTAPLTVLEAQPDQVATRDITVTNTGSLDATLGDARLIDSDLSNSAPLTVTASTCQGRTIAPGQSCAVTVRYSPGPAGSPEGNGILVVPADLGEVELGRVVGQQPASLSGPQNVTVTPAPGRVDISWKPPSTLDSRLISSWRIEEDISGSTTVLRRLISSYEQSSSLTGLGVGIHSLRVVMRTGDGREISSAPVVVTVPRRWLLVATTSGVRALDPDGGTTAAEPFVIGSSSGISTVGVAFSPARDKVVVAQGPATGWIEAYSTTGSPLRFLSSQPLFGDDGPAVSPDGARVISQRLGYTGSETRDSSLVLVPTIGGAETVVPTSSGLRAPSWTPDGSAVIAELHSGAGLVKVALGTGARTPLPGTNGGRSPAVSRTGRVAYITRVGGGDEIRLTSLAGGASTRIGLHDGVYELAWDPSGRWLAATGGLYGNPEHTYVYDTAATTPLVRTLPAGGRDVAWLDTSSMAPVASLAAPAWTTRTASLTVDATDSDDAVGGLRRECRLDTATAWTACGSTLSLSALAPGRHTAYAQVTDPSGNRSAAATRSWSVDAAAPTAALGTVPSVLAGVAFTLTWTAADSGGSGLASYDARERYAASSGRFGGYVYPAAWQGLRARSLALRMGPGYQYCFSTRARDVAGNVGAWSAERCTAVALDDRAMSATRGWTRGTSTAYAYGTWSRAARSAVSLSRGSVQGRRIVLVATTCPTCGSVDVYHAGIRLGRVSLYSAKTAYRQLRWLPLQSVTRTGTVVVRTTSSKVVYVDGVAVVH